MGLSEQALAIALGLDVAAIPLMAAGAKHLDPKAVSGQRALTLLKIYSAWSVTWVQTAWHAVDGFLRRTTVCKGRPFCSCAVKKGWQVH